MPVWLCPNPKCMNDKELHAGQRVVPCAEKMLKSSVSVRLAVCSKRSIVPKSRWKETTETRECVTESSTVRHAAQRTYFGLLGFLNFGRFGNAKNADTGDHWFLKTESWEQNSEKNGRKNIQNPTPATVNRTYIIWVWGFIILKSSKNCYCNRT
jgi:hypothetical protein